MFSYTPTVTLATCLVQIMKYGKMKDLIIYMQLTNEKLVNVNIVTVGKRKCVIGR
jgi:hypothetical protein